MAPQLPTPLLLVALLLGAAGLAAADDSTFYTCSDVSDPAAPSGCIQAHPFVPSIPGAAVVVSTPCGSGQVVANVLICDTMCCPSVNCVPLPKTFPGDTTTYYHCGCPSGAVCGDPHFQGAQGVSFDFQGWPDHEYALVSDQDFQLSAHMIGQEVAETGVTGTWMSRLGFMYNFEGKTNRVELALKEVDDVVTDTIVLLVNGVVVDLPTPNLLATDIGLNLTVKSSAELQVQVGEYVTAEISVAEHQFPDGFHFDFALSHLRTTSAVHGVLGQTFAPERAQHLAALVVNVLAGTRDSYTESDVIDGTEGDYEISDLFATDFAYNRYAAPGTGLSLRKLLGSPAPVEVAYLIAFDGSAMNVVPA